MKPLAPVVGAVLGSLGGIFWWVGRRAARGAVPLFLTLGALESVPGHLHGIYGRGLLEHCLPVLGTTPTSALVFGFFEFAFYWSVILAVAAFVARRMEGWPQTGVVGNEGPPASRRSDTGGR
jgi:hypothetical protein